MRTRKGIRVGILGAVVAAAITPGVAMAADFTVTTTADGDDEECALDCTLREAVVLAGSADRVLVPNGTYVLTAGELSLNNDTIIGEDARKTVIDGDDKWRVSAGDRGHVAGVERDDPQRQRRRSRSGAGGGIFIHSGALQLQNSTVSDNNATSGGGIAANGVAQLIGVTVSGNRASTGRLTRGGGIATSTTGALLLGNSTVSGNTAVDAEGAASQGGGVFSSGTLAIIASTIAGNSAGRGRWPVLVAPPTGAATSLQSSLLSHGTGGACGGPGIDNLNATANVASDATCQFKDPSNLAERQPADRRAGRQRWADQHPRAPAGEPGDPPCGELRGASTSAASTASRPATRAPTSTGRRRSTWSRRSSTTRAATSIRAGSPSTCAAAASTCRAARNPARRAARATRSWRATPTRSPPTPWPATRSRCPATARPTARSRSRRARRAPARSRPTTSPRGSR